MAEDDDGDDGTGQQRGSLLKALSPADPGGDNLNRASDRETYHHQQRHHQHQHQQQQQHQQQWVAKPRFGREGDGLVFSSDYPPAATHASGAASGKGGASDGASFASGGVGSGGGGAGEGVAPHIQDFLQQ